MSCIQYVVFSGYTSYTGLCLWGRCKSILHYPIISYSIVYALTGTIQAHLMSLYPSLCFTLLYYMYGLERWGILPYVGGKGVLGLHLVAHVIVVVLTVVYHMLWYVLFTVRGYYCIWWCPGFHVFSIWSSGDVKLNVKILSFRYPYILCLMI